MKPQTEAKILNFNRPEPMSETRAASSPDGDESSEEIIMSSEVILMQREISRETISETRKSSAKSGYEKATEMYVVKSTDLDGKQKIRFASTNGVLINKKQA